MYEKYYNVDARNDQIKFCHEFKFETSVYVNTENSKAHYLYIYMYYTYYLV